MKTFLNLLLIQIFLLNFITAQDIYIEIKTEASSTNPKFILGSNINDESKENKIAQNFSVGLNSKLGEHFFFKTTYGSNDFRSKANLSWGTDGISHEIAGSISVEQNYLEFLPELRFFKSKWLYLNIGMGFCKVKSSKLSEGFYRRGSEVFFSNESFPDFGGKYEYFVGHLGVNLNYKFIGIILEYGYRRSGYTEKGSEAPRMGINQTSFSLGVSYKIK